MGKNSLYSLFFYKYYSATKHLHTWVLYLYQGLSFSSAFHKLLIQTCWNKGYCKYKHIKIRWQCNGNSGNWHGFKKCVFHCFIQERIQVVAESFCNTSRALSRNEYRRRCISKLVDRWKILGYVTINWTLVLNRGENFRNWKCFCYHV